MTWLLAQQVNVWNAEPATGTLFLKTGIALVFGLALILGFTFLPAQARKPIVATITFIAGLFWVSYFLWPRPFDRKPTDEPVGFVEKVGFWLTDAVPHVSTFGNILTSFLIGLGIYSILRIHLGRVIKQQKDWSFSLILLVSMFVMIVAGYANWFSRLGPDGAKLELQENWGFVNYAADFLFDGLLQQMDAVMFSLIAFFILSAGYRAFRIRSVEAAILLGVALIVIMNFLGGVVFAWDQFVNIFAGKEGSERYNFMNNFRLSDIQAWIQDTLQTPSVRAFDFGVGVGALAMSLRLWLSLEKTGGSN